MGDAMTLPKALEKTGTLEKIFSALPINAIVPFEIFLL
jgi:hypothetical protein